MEAEAQMTVAYHTRSSYRQAMPCIPTNETDVSCSSSISMVEKRGPAQRHAGVSWAWKTAPYGGESVGDAIFPSASFDQSSAFTQALGGLGICLSVGKVDELHSRESLTASA